MTDLTFGKFPTFASDTWMSVPFRPDVDQAEKDATEMVKKFALTPEQVKNLDLNFDFSTLFGPTVVQPQAQRDAAAAFTAAWQNIVYLTQYVLAQPWLRGTVPVADGIRAWVEYSTKVFMFSPGVAANGRPVLPGTNTSIPFRFVNGKPDTSQAVPCIVYVPVPTRIPDDKGGWQVISGHFVGNYSGSLAVALRLWADMPAKTATAYQYIYGFEYPAAPVFSENTNAGNNAWRNALNKQYAQFNAIAVGRALETGTGTVPGLYLFEQPDQHFDVTGLVFDIFVTVFTAYGLSVMSAAGSAPAAGANTFASAAKQMVTDPVGFLKERAANALAKPVTLVRSFITDPVGATLDLAHEKIKQEIIKVTGPLGRVYDIAVDPAGFVRDKITSEILYPLEHPGDWIVDQAKAQMHNKITGEIRNAITGLMIQPAIIVPGVVSVGANVSAPVSVETVATVPTSAPAKASGGFVVPVALIALVWELLS